MGYVTTHVELLDKLMLNKNAFQGKDGVYEPSKELAEWRKQNKENVPHLTSKKAITPLRPQPKYLSYGIKYPLNQTCNKAI